MLMRLYKAVVKERLMPRYYAPLSSNLIHQNAKLVLNERSQSEAKKNSSSEQVIVPEKTALKKFKSLGNPNLNIFY